MTEVIVSTGALWLGRSGTFTVAYHNAGDEILLDTLSSMIRQLGLSKRLFRK